MHFSEIEECSMTNIDIFLEWQSDCSLTHCYPTFTHLLGISKKVLLYLLSNHFINSFKEETIKYIHKYFKIRKVKNKIKSRVNSAQNT